MRTLCTYRYSGVCATILLAAGCAGGPGPSYQRTSLVSQNYEPIRSVQSSEPDYNPAPQQTGAEVRQSIPNSAEPEQITVPSKVRGIYNRPVVRPDESTPARSLPRGPVAVVPLPYPGLDTLPSTMVGYNPAEPALMTVLSVESHQIRIGNAVFANRPSRINE